MVHFMYHTAKEVVKRSLDTRISLCGLCSAGPAAVRTYLAWLPEEYDCRVVDINIEQ